MGNAQSTGPHHRLSKPKTNTNSPFGTPKADSSPASVSLKYADLSIEGRQQLKAHLTSPVETEFDPNAYTYENDGIGELASHVQVRLSGLSRSNSVMSQFGSGRDTSARLASLPGSKLSLVSNTERVDLDTAIKILHEVRRNASPEDLAALHQALQPTTSPPPDADHIPSRRTSVVNRSSSSLIRRRSLIATPGLATRSSPNPAPRRTWNSWKPSHAETEVTPQADLPKKHKWNVEMMGTSPLTRLAALDLAEDGRGSPAPRAQTPGDMDYSHLGSLKLGSLVVTNGAASPAPSGRDILRRRSNADVNVQEDYFTEPGGATTWKQATKRGHKRSKSSVLPTSPPLYRNVVVHGNQKNKPVARSESPLKTEASAQQDIRDTRLHAHVEPGNLVLHFTDKSAETLAKDYMSEIPNSPFIVVDPTTHEHDEGFVDCTLDDAMSFRKEAFRILDGTVFSEPSMSFDSPRPSFQENTPEKLVTLEKSRKGSPSILSQAFRKSRKKDRRPTPKKADSGYSSGGSFRIGHRQASHEGGLPTILKKPSFAAVTLKDVQGSESDDVTSLYTFEQMLALPISKPLPPVPTIENVDYRPAQPEVLVPLEPALSPSPISPRTVTSAASYWTADTTMSSNQRRLQKRRPSYQELPVVQSCPHTVDGTIPNVPDNVRAKFVRRLSEAPEMECLTHTYLSKEHIKAEESAIDNPFPMDLDFDAASPTPSPRPRHHTRSQTERPPTPPRHGVRRSLSWFRKSGAAEAKQEFPIADEKAVLGLIDLGTVGSALGSSPYDIALSSHSRKAVTSPTHPHQLGTSMPRTKSTVTMDAETAAKVARMRSKDRALLRPEMPQRPRSYHDMNLEAGEAMAFRSRPRSVHADMPSVPPAEAEVLSHTPDSAHRRHQPQQPPAEVTLSGAQSSLNFRARSTGRGPVVSQLVDKYDKTSSSPSVQPDWDAHARLWSQRRKSIGEGLRQHAQASQVDSSRPDERASSQPPEDMTSYGRYSGGLHYGYEGRGYGVGGSAGTRVLHSASRKSMHFSTEFGVDLSDVPIFVQRM
ncbi:hypothetical protein K491DRAFT_278993 [Lophiostoma macrostomum CBS 122681]|uniref:Uncharacterized protein n=1 Tax=Lophiostoma macrostomum CBS 122681 TaxID=1314788 RepID=A0A6A6SLE1_9PLEO|nr:hypothetical protein K491DRAFT_278993 [Lophiostoma macrostomum CBS 122681]